MCRKLSGYWKKSIMLCQALLINRKAFTAVLG